MGEDKFVESVQQCQLESDTPCVKKVIHDLSPYVGDELRRPVVLHAELGNRVEYLHIVRELQTCRNAIIRTKVEPRELAKTFEDTHPDGCVYVPGDTLSHALQRKIVARDQTISAPPTFIVMTHLHPDRLCMQNRWRPEFRLLFGSRIVRIPSADERKPSELVELFKNAVRTAAARESLDFEIKPGVLTLLELTWTTRPPMSLDFVVAAANKSVALAKIKTLELVEAAKRAAQIVIKETRRLIITGKEIVDTITPDSALATREPDDVTTH